MFWLIVSALMVDGSYQSMAVKYKTLADCEAGLPKAHQMVQKNKEAITAYIAVCVKPDVTGEAS